MKHLPGPYKVERKPNKGGWDNIKIVAAWVVSGQGDARRVIATINTDNPFSGYNADLLAAAPDFFAALKEIADLADKWSNEQRTSVPYWNLGDIARAAIVKSGMEL